MIEVLTIDEAAERLKVSRRVVLRLCLLERLPGARKVGRCWRVPSTAIAAFFGGASSPTAEEDSTPEAATETPAAPFVRPNARSAARRAKSRAEFMKAIG